MGGVRPKKSPSSTQPTNGIGKKEGEKVMGLSNRKVGDQKSGPFVGVAGDGSSPSKGA